MDQKNNVTGKCNECAEFAFAILAGEELLIPTCTMNNGKATCFVSPEECRFRRKENE